MQNLKTKKRVFIKKKWGSPKKKGAPLSNKKPGLMVRFFVAHNHPLSNHPSSFVTESGFPVTTEVRRGVFVTDCGFPVTTKVRRGAFVTDCGFPVTTEVRRGAFVTDCGVLVTTEVRRGHLSHGVGFL